LSVWAPKYLFPFFFQLIISKTDAKNLFGFQWKRTDPMRRTKTNPIQKNYIKILLIMLWCRIFYLQKCKDVQSIRLTSIQVPGLEITTSWYVSFVWTVLALTVFLYLLMHHLGKHYFNLGSPPAQVNEVYCESHFSPVRNIELIKRTQS
jgi:hypothetical protein